MSVLFFILGGIVLVYWFLNIIQPIFNRPEIIRRHGWVIFLVGLALLLLGIVT